MSYFNYRTTEFEVLDHGIIGGLLLYKKLLTNYLEKYKQYCDEKEISENDLRFPCHFQTENLDFSPQHLPLWNYISQCIIAHNIWKCSPGDEEKYKKYNLTNMIGQNFKKISLHENPLLFLLSLVDTLEPIKRIEGKPDRLDALKKIEFNAFREEKACILRFQYPNANQASNLCGQLKDWINVETTTTPDNCLEISFDDLG